MSDPGTTTYLYTVCQAGVESSLKKEMARLDPGFAFAFSRPGFVTFKKKSEPLDVSPELRLSLVLARAYGACFGRIQDDPIPRVLALARELSARFDAGSALRLHVWERDRFRPGEEPLGFVQGQWSSPVEARIRAADTDGLFDREIEARTGDLVIDVIAVEEIEFWLGAHRQSADRLGLPGGRAVIALPPDAPSRAYAKMEEALLWSGAPIRAGDLAVEVGSAPGGSSLCLLRKGLDVIGMDPAAMAPLVLAHPRFRHIARSAINVLPSDLPEQIQWLIFDMNAGPDVTVPILADMVEARREHLIGLLLTIKLNTEQTYDWIPDVLEQVQELGMSRVRAIQLSGNRSEFFVYALTRKGALRL